MTEAFLITRKTKDTGTGSLTAMMHFLKLATNGRDIENVSVLAKAPPGEAAALYPDNQDGQKYHPFHPRHFHQWERYSPCGF